jgi:hypothetical protein
VVGNWMVTTNVVMDFAVRRGWGNGSRRGPRNDTEDHGIGEGTIGWLARGGFTTKDTEGTKRTGGNRGGKSNGDYKCSNGFCGEARMGE